jgi:uncharacterized protein YcbK (DUF882 family)
LSIPSRPDDRLALGRRAFLRVAGIAFAGACLLPRAARAGSEPRRLRMEHTHTGERADVTYYERGQYLPDALAEIDRFLRDFRTGDVREIAPPVLDIAWSVVRQAGASGAVIQIVSAYRSPATNAALRARGRGVAPRSLHVDGRAIDLRVQGVQTARLRDAALALGAGGVGYYAGSDFVHVDDGPVRRWSS